MLPLLLQKIYVIPDTGLLCRERGKEDGDGERKREKKRNFYEHAPCPCSRNFVFGSMAARYWLLVSDSTLELLIATLGLKGADGFLRLIEHVYNRPISPPIGMLTRDGEIFHRWSPLLWVAVLLDIVWASLVAKHGHKTFTL